MEVLFFDMDGTLVDSLPAAFRIYEEVMLEHGHEPTFAEFVELGSKSPREALFYLAERLKTDPIKLGIEYQKRLSRCYCESVELFPGAKAVVEEMKQLDRPMLLVTAADSAVARVIVEKHGLSHFFDHVVTADDLHESRLPSKPDPAIYKKALELAKIAPHQGVAFEDSTVGIRSSKGAGLRSVWMNHKADEFHPDYAHLIDHTFNDWQTATTWLKDGIKSPKS